MNEEILKFCFRIATKMVTEVETFCSIFGDENTRSGEVLETWTSPNRGKKRAISYHVDAFSTSIEIPREAPSPLHDSPQRAEWVGDDTTNFAAEKSFPQFQHEARFLSSRRHGKATSGRKDPINWLPAELLRHVFRFLPDQRDRFSCALVCKSWLFLQSHLHQDELVRSEEERHEIGDEAQSKEVIYTCRNETRVDRRQPQWAIGDLSRCLQGRKASDVRLAAVAVGTGARGGLGKLSLRRSTVTDIGLSAIGHCCSALKTLCLWECPSIGDDGLSLIAKGCRLLEKLDLYKCSTFGDQGLQCIAENCTLLSTLTLDECSGITDKALIAIGEGCQNLLSLSIRSCPLMGNNGLISAVCKLKRLKCLKLDGIKVGDRSLTCIGLHAKALTCLCLANLELVSHKGFMSLSLAHDMRSLERLTVANCNNFGDDIFLTMGRMWEGVKHVSLTRCSNITDMGLSLLIQNGTSLEVLQLEICSSITARGVFSVLTNKHGKLRKFSVRDCLGIQDVGYFPYIQFPAISSVKSLSLAGCVGFGNMFLALIGCTCPHVTNIDFSGLTNVNDEGILAFLYSGRRQLTNVNLNACLELTDRSICAIAEQCGETLRSLSLNGCAKITDKALKVMSKHCISIEDLDISNCGVTDDGITVLLVKSGPTLSSLNLAGCMGITERILPVIKEKCHSLSDLNLKHCQGLSQKSIYSFESKTWRCNVLCE